jgi:hypothetical protein
VLLLAISSAGTVTAPAASPQVPPVPNVQAPEVPVPSLPAPPLPAPSAPAVPSVPEVAVPVPAPVPAVPAVPEVQAPHGGALQPGDALSAGSSVPGSGSGVRAVAPVAGSVGAMAGAVAGRVLARPPSGAFARDRGTRRAQRTAIRRVRRKLRPVRDCLHLLERRPRRALVLHLGLGDARPRSRQAVARRLGTSWRRVRRMERLSIARLRRADRAGACDADGSPATILGIPDAAEASFAVAAFTGAPAGGAPAGTGEVRGQRESGGADEERDDGADAAPGRDRPIGLVDTAAEDLQTLALILGGLLAAGVAVALLLARLRRPERPMK